MNSLKKLLSYIIEIPVEKTESEFSGKVAVSFHKNQYKLSTKNAVYSFGKNYTSFSTAFEAIEIENKKIESVLVLGFGLGSVVDLLEDHKEVKKITAVDADKIIIKLAKKYLHSPLKNKINFICSDAETFVNEIQQQFDLVLFDVFIDDVTPSQFIRKEFLLQLKKLMSEKGILLFSKLETDRKSKIENDQFEKIFSEVFPASFSIDADGNKIFVMINSPSF